MSSNSHPGAPSDLGPALNSNADGVTGAERPIKRTRLAIRVLSVMLLAVVLGAAFLGHLSPDMQMQWENLMALCGF